MLLFVSALIGIFLLTRWLGVFLLVLIDLAALERQIPGLAAKVHFVDAPLLEISSSDIRQRIACGGDVSAMLPPAVLDYIRRHHLYGHP